MYMSGRGLGVTKLWAADLDEGWPQTQAPAPQILVTYGFIRQDRVGVEVI
jgi:hypothetical protein